MRPEIALALLLLICGTESAQCREPAASVDSAIRASLKGKSIQVLPNAGGMMPACRSRLMVRWMQSTSPSFRTGVVSCEAPAWTVYAGVRVTERWQVLIATRPIPVGGTIDQTDTKVTSIEAADLRGSPLKIAAIGVKLKSNQPLVTGQPVLASMVNIPVAIISGQTVDITVNDNGVIVSASGLALQNGRIGEIIEVENTQSHSRFNARVVQSVPAQSGVYLTTSSP